MSERAEPKKKPKHVDDYTQIYSGPGFGRKLGRKAWKKYSRISPDLTSSSSHKNI
jgi:hypothetical protein